MKSRRLFLIAVLMVVLTCGYASAKAKKEFSGIVNINTATAAELVLLPGIGESKAKAIVDFRQQQSFDSIDDIQKVSGVGERLFVSLKPYITVSSPTAINSYVDTQKSDRLPKAAGTAK